jgi:hypothetical protein
MIQSVQVERKSFMTVGLLQQHCEYPSGPQGEEISYAAQG